MSKSDSLCRVLSSGIVAVIRANRGDRLADVAEALLAGGVEVMEVTFTVPNAVRVLEQVAERLGSKILLGAGTVLDPETARAALLAGAEFIVSPSTNVAVIELCRRYDKLVMPGAFTPTEVVAAWQAGADIVKIFPSDVHGPKYLKALRGPLPQVRMMPTGGVSLDNLKSRIHDRQSRPGRSGMRFATNIGPRFQGHYSITGDGKELAKASGCTGLAASVVENLLREDWGPPARSPN